MLRAGASASDTIHTINHQGTCLTTSTKLRIYPPGNRASLVFPGHVTNCHNLFSVTPFTAGTQGNPSNAGSEPAPSPTATPAPTRSATASAQPRPQVSTVPSGAPDTGVPLAAGGGSHGTTVVAGSAAGGVLALGGLGAAVRRRTSRTASQD